MKVIADPREDEYQDLLEFLYLCPVGVVECDRHGAIRRLNPVASQLLLPLGGNGRLDNFFDLLDRHAPELRNLAHDFDSQSGTICQDHRIDTGVPHGSGVTHLAVTLVQLRADRIAAVVSDVGESVLQETALREKESQLRAIFDNLREYAVHTLGPDGAVDGWNASGQRLYGYEPADVIGRRDGMFYDPATTQAADEALRLANANGWHEQEGWRVRMDGSRFWANCVTTVLVGETGNVRGYSVIARDMTDRKCLEDRLRRMANTDYLTEAFTRRYFCEAGERELKRFQRHGGSLSVILIDADHFKHINDSLGHAAGDAVLKAVSAVCRETIRGEDVFGRLGGEEFGILLPSTDRGGAIILAERLRTLIEGLTIPCEGQSANVTVSSGVVDATKATDTFDALISQADRLLYEAKAAGRNRVVSRSATDRA